MESWEDVEDVDDDRVDSTVGTRGMGIPLVLLSLEWTDEAFSPEDLNAERKDWIMLTLVEVEEVSFESCLVLLLLRIIGPSLFRGQTQHLFLGKKVVSKDSVAR